MSVIMSKKKDDNTKQTILKNKSLAKFSLDEYLFNHDIKLDKYNYAYFDRKYKDVLLSNVEWSEIIN